MPFAKRRPSGRQRQQESIPQWTRDPGQSIGVWKRVLKSSRFPVIQDEGAIVGPPAGGESEALPIQLTAVHGSQIDQGSVGNGCLNRPKAFIDAFVAHQALYRITAGLSLDDGTDNVGPAIPHGRRGRVVPISLCQHPRVIQRSYRICRYRIQTLAGACCSAQQRE